MPTRRLHHSPPRHLAGRGLLWALGLAAGAVTPLKSESNGSEAWQDLREWRFVEAAQAFARTSDAPSSRLGHAVALLNLQPRTADRLARVERELTELAEDAGASTDVTVAARYLLARIAEVHASVPNPARAAELYEALLGSHPRHPLTQTAVSRLATLRLYRLGADPLRTLADLESLGDHLAEAGARRDFHLVMGRSYLFFGGERRRALEHFEAAMTAGIVAPAARANVLVQVGELAHEFNQTVTARRVWSEFVRDFPRDLRVDLVKQQLNALPGEARP